MTVVRANYANKPLAWLKKLTQREFTCVECGERAMGWDGHKEGCELAAYIRLSPHDLPQTPSSG